MSEELVLARRVAVLGMAYLVRTFQELAEFYGGGQNTLIALGIFAANAGHLDVRGEDPSIVGPDGVLHDEERRPISVSRLAKSLGLPFETTRQHVNQLIDAGICIRVNGGVVVPKATMQRPELVAGVMGHLDAVRQLVRDLQAVGLDVGSPAAGPGEAGGD
jgi:hypothetical protein